MYGELNSYMAVGGCGVGEQGTPASLLVVMAPGSAGGSWASAVLDRLAGWAVRWCM